VPPAPRDSLFLLLEQELSAAAGRCQRRDWIAGEAAYPAPVERVDVVRVRPGGGLAARLVGAVGGGTRPRCLGCAPRGTAGGLLKGGAYPIAGAS
jgi:hypothetical protein